MDIKDLLICDDQRAALDEVVLDNAQRKLLDNLVREQRFAKELTRYCLPADNKLLLHGCSGCGKTLVAKALATSLERELLVLDLANIVSARIGETSRQLKMVFERAAGKKTILFLDEFDLVAKSRGSNENDVGEMRRLVNTLIQLIDYFPKGSLLIAATNHLEVIDPALVRRFQLKVEFVLPGRETLDSYYDALLADFPQELRGINRIFDVSFAQARDLAYTQVKSSLLEGLEKQSLNPNENGQ